MTRFKQKVKQLTGRNWGVSMEYRLTALRRYLVGWMNYFGITEYYRPIPDLDGWIRRRIRMCYWRQWRRIRTRIRMWSRTRPRPRRRPTVPHLMAWVRDGKGRRDRIVTLPRPLLSRLRYHWKHHRPKSHCDRLFVSAKTGGPPLPSELRQLVRSHQRALLDVLFRAAYEALSEMCADERHLGGRIGALAVLHTWTRALVYHQVCAWASDSLALRSSPGLDALAIATRLIATDSPSGVKPHAGDRQAREYAPPQLVRRDVSHETRKWPIPLRSHLGTTRASVARSC